MENRVMPARSRGKGVGGMDEEGPKAKRKENRTVCHLRVNRLRDSALTGL